MLARENDSLVPPSGQQQNSLFFGFYDNGGKKPSTFTKYQSTNTQVPTHYIMTLTNPVVKAQWPFRNHNVPTSWMKSLGI